MRELWAELSESMRMLRRSAELSLRQVEAASGVGRGTLSQIENSKSKPNRGVVEWYDTNLHGDGLLLSLFAEARAARGAERPRAATAASYDPDDAASIDALLPSGLLAAPGSELVGEWILHNVGTVRWTQRRLRRVGAHRAVRLVGSDLSVPLDDCAPGDRVKIAIPLTLPDLAGSYVAYWQFVDARGRHCLPDSSLAVRIVAA